MIFTEKPEMPVEYLSSLVWLKNVCQIHFKIQTVLLTLWEADKLDTERIGLDALQLNIKTVESYIHGRIVKRKKNNQSEIRKNLSADTPQNILIFHVYVKRFICDVESMCIFSPFYICVCSTGRYTSKLISVLCI